MKGITAMCVFAAISIGDCRAAAGGTREPAELEIVLRSTGSDSLMGDGHIEVRATNHGHSTLYLPKPHTPLFTPDAHLMNNVFKVVNERDEPARFIGRYVNVLRNDAEAFYAKLEPGETQSHIVDLAADYQLLPGVSYSVSYQQPYAHSYARSDDGELVDDSGEVSSNRITFVLSTDRTPGVRSRAEDSSKTCNPEQIDAVSEARSDALIWVRKATARMESLYFVETRKDESGNDVHAGRLRQDNSYDYWFGPAENSGKHFGYKPTYVDYWKSENDFYMMRSLNSLALRIGGESYLCGCPSSYPWNTAAWTQTYPSNVIHLCDFFFTLPVSNGAYDSQRLTVIHEISHFVDLWGGETADHVYGRENSHALGQSNRNAAVRNADSLMYFIGTLNQ